MDLKNIILNKRRKIQKSFQCLQCWFHLYKLLEQAKLFYSDQTQKRSSMAGGADQRAA